MPHYFVRSRATALVRKHALAQASQTAQVQRIIGGRQIYHVLLQIVRQLPETRDGHGVGDLSRPVQKVAHEDTVLLLVLFFCTTSRF